MIISNEISKIKNLSSPLPLIEGRKITRYSSHERSTESRRVKHESRRGVLIPEQASFKSRETLMEFCWKPRNVPRNHRYRDGKRRSPKLIVLYYRIFTVISVRSSLLQELASPRYCSSLEVEGGYSLPENRIPATRFFFQRRSWRTSPRIRRQKASTMLHESRAIEE